MEGHCNLCNPEANWGMEVWVHSFIIWELDGQRFASCLSRFTVEETDSGNNWTGGWVGPRSGLHTAEKEVSLPWFRTFFVLWMSYSFFWEIPRRLGTLHKSCEHHLWRWNRQSVPKRPHIKFRRRGITEKKDYNEVSLTRAHNRTRFLGC
jgi:hypothetical protein